MWILIQHHIVALAIAAAIGVLVAWWFFRDRRRPADKGEEEA